ncbi:hypothetical protein HO133_006307 [Letharia lupina]|uniref:Uncharacterized protein n=1 Tax=Letharia lupina TaxID=560253 RepID=A0A8H6F792_9LECA|nr:uncharacterized protein HO133_006307 [Letharia lupina]KAF6217895.1 hypothetical protein HO133_006307 [Letharia lupina]
MATVASLETSPSKVNSIRERELYRYFQPPESPKQQETLSVHAASSPNTTLTALAQLCALRLHAKRAMISVIDREKQYFVAESTKTLDLVNNSKSEEEGDGLWFGCGTVDKSGRLCEKTIELPPSLACSPSVLTVTDLSKDERFNRLPFVTGPPYFRFYAGTPLTTNKGVNIGSLFILDDVARPQLSNDHELFLATIAQTVIKHMEITMEADERKKVMRLSLGMNAFVEGKSRLVLDDLTHKMGMAHKDCSNSDGGLTKKRTDSGNKPLMSNNGTHSDQDSSQEDSDFGKTSRNVDTGHRMTFARASNILCESLEIRERGGVVYFDATSRHGTETRDSHDRKSQRPAEIVSYSTPESDLFLENQPSETKSFKPVDETLLHSLLARYPRGKLWSFDRDGSLSSSEEEPLSPRERTKSEGSRQIRANRKQVEAMLLQQHFPGVRQLIFSGLWDASSSRWFTGGFAWTTSSRQIFSRETELSFFMAFGNSVMAEVSRLASIAADRQKADFIGSISHEFRSPLHGILASAEFLADTEADAFQSSLVDTISSCGRTLLDTINHILDYSKINSFERNWRNVRKPGSRARGAANRRIADKEAPPMMNIYATVDVAAVTEEVVEGVYAGQIYQDISSTEATDFSNGAKAEALDRGIHVGNQSRVKKVSAVKAVEVILDIAHENYVFTTQPGALKRVIMNIFGNALKYTQKGSIVVKLALSPSNHDAMEDTERILEIKVMDTGRGISSEYLRTSLYNPFCQEDVLASGTGLGLSIVKSILTMLRGTIDVQSEVGKGTDITIRVPLSRVPGTDTPVSTPSTDVSVDGTSQDDSMRILQADYQATTIALYAFHSTEFSSEMTEVGRTIKTCIEDWFGLRACLSLSELTSKDIIVVDEKDLAELVTQNATPLPTVVICSNSTRSKAASRQNMPAVTEFVSKPFGPHKLAKALRLCLDKARDYHLGLTPVIPFSSGGPGSLKSEAGTAIPHLEHLTIETEDDLRPLRVQTNGILTASESDNAQMAIDHWNTGSSNDTIHGTLNDGQNFPFPDQSQQNQSETNPISPRSPVKENVAMRDRPMGDLTRRESRRPPLISRMTEPAVRTAFPHSLDRSFYDSSAITKNGETAAFETETPLSDAAKAHVLNGTNSSSLTASNMALHNGKTPNETPKAQLQEPDKRPPRLLLVDDNKINLRLLETYMRKRKYKLVDSAENGQLAVQAAESHEHGYDIIFMDISMPVLNGFEATRAIRDIEEARSHNRKDGHGPSPALIIALTGLASSRDQSEAFTSGVDLFMTKPVSFKEVGRLLDNWEAHGGVKPSEEEANGHAT